jgi:hypothetical protein
MAYAHRTGQLQHMLGTEHITDQTVVLTQKKFIAITGHDACRILSTMLQQGQRVIQ